mgnify:CR=1 FL=1|tara:strand:+ start:241 stop:603 length:363 start_codon:yes stop_codon:yes gene_type:complete
MYEKYQQGDVILRKISKEAFELNKLNHRVTKHDDRALLAEGEATGHAHAVYMDDLLEGAEVTLCKQYESGRQNEGIIVTGNPVEIRHEEHNTITLEPGYYLQRIVKEYDHISGITRRVAD